MMRRREKCYTRGRKGLYIDVGQVKEGSGERFGKELGASSL
jgi:hypothetical protein